MSDDAEKTEDRWIPSLKFDGIGKIPESFFEIIKSAQAENAKVLREAFSVDAANFPDPLAGRWATLDASHIARPLEPLEIPPNPTYEVIDRLEAQQTLLIESNTHLEEMVKIARADAAAARAESVEARKTTRHSLAAAWIGVGVALVLGVFSIVMMA